MKMTRKIGNYIAENKIDAKVVSEATGVKVELLRKEPAEGMKAAEFLAVCAYLKIRPEDLAAE